MKWHLIPRRTIVFETNNNEEALRKIISAYFSQNEKKIQWKSEIHFTVIETRYHKGNAYFIKSNGSFIKGADKQKVSFTTVVENTNKHFFAIFFQTILIAVFILGLYFSFKDRTIGFLNIAPVIMFIFSYIISNDDSDIISFHEDMYKLVNSTT